MLEYFVMRWAGYDAEERALQRRIRRADLVGFPLFVMLYFRGIAVLPAVDWLGLPGGAPRVPPGASGVSLLRCGACLSALLVIWQHVMAAPFPTKDIPNSFTAQGTLGKWVYLTRHTLCLQAIHLVVTALEAAVSDRLLALTLAQVAHGAAPIVAMMGIFVTIQYFILVFPSPGNKAEQVKWAQRGVPFKELGIMLHSPCGVLAALDMLVLKDRRAVLEAYTTVRGLSMMAWSTLVYVVFYMALIHTNYHLCGAWPYTFMSSWGAAVAKWVPFILIQFMILVSCFVGLITLAWLTPSAW